MWVLVYIILNGSEPMAVNAYGPKYTFPDMYSCFEAREKLSVDVGGMDGYFPQGMQAVCVLTKESSVQLSLVKRLVWVQETGGSNPFTETNKKK